MSDREDLANQLAHLADRAKECKHVTFGEDDVIDGEVLTELLERAYLAVAADSLEPTRRSTVVKWGRVGSSYRVPSTSLGPYIDLAGIQHKIEREVHQYLVRPVTVKLSLRVEVNSSDRFELLFGYGDVVYEEEL